MILIGQSLEFITGLTYHKGVLCAAAVFALLSLLDDMTVIARLSVVGVVASILYVLCIGCAGVQAAQDSGEARTYMLVSELSQLSEVGAVASVMLLGFTYQTVVPTLRAEMRAPREMPRAIAGAIGVAAGIYMGAGTLGYYGWGDRVEGNVLSSMRTGDGSPMWEGLVLSCAVIANLAVSFPILMTCVYRAAEAQLGGYSPMVRFVLLSVALAVGMLVPYFLTFI